MANKGFLGRLVGERNEADSDARQMRALLDGIRDGTFEVRPKGDGPAAVAAAPTPPPVEQYIAQEQDGWTRIWLLINPEGVYQDVRWSENTNGDAVTSHLAHFAMAMTDWMLTTGSRGIANLIERNRLLEAEIADLRADAETAY